MANDDFGTDLCWNSTVDKLETVTGDDNLTQSIRNRLSTTYDELGWIYEDYGCNYRDYLGLKTDDESLEFIKNSIQQSLEEDDRIGEFELDVSYQGDGKVNCVIIVDGVTVEVDL